MPPETLNTVKLNAANVRPKRLRTRDSQPSGIRSSRSMVRRSSMRPPKMVSMVEALCTIVLYETDGFKDEVGVVLGSTKRSVRREQGKFGIRSF